MNYRCSYSYRIIGIILLILTPGKMPEEIIMWLNYKDLEGNKVIKAVMAPIYLEQIVSIQSNFLHSFQG